MNEMGAKTLKANSAIHVESPTHQGLYTFTKNSTRPSAALFLFGLSEALSRVSEPSAVVHLTGQVTFTVLSAGQTA
jgi:hypothetical protein